MSSLKTRRNDADPRSFIESVDQDKRREDALYLLDFMTEITGESPKMWGGSIVGYGSYHYKYDSGREGDWFLTGFSPRKQNLSVYIMAGFDGYEELMQKLGKHKTGKSCLYINKLEDIDVEVLRELIEESVKYMKAKYGQ